MSSPSRPTLARRAGTILTDSYERIERIDYKSKRDVVTNADYASERLVIDAIKARYPGDAILAEESGEHAGVLRDDGSNNGRTWVSTRSTGPSTTRTASRTTASASVSWSTTPDRRRHPRSRAR